jgi:hypothetical protein
VGQAGAIAGVIAIAIVWAGYGFALQRLRQGMQLAAGSMPTFQHFPKPVRRIATGLIDLNPLVPAPALLRGFASAWTMESSQPDSYLFGHIKQGGWWYFFLVGIAVKLPISFSILVLAGLCEFRRLFEEGRWRAMCPVVCACAMLLVTMPVKINYGVRHVLVVFPLLAIVAGYGCSYLWHATGRYQLAKRVALIGLLVWQGISSIGASSDYIAYFNELAGSDPSKVMVAGCDLDCGQDLFRLADELRARKISHVTLALRTSADLSKADLPEFEIAQPYASAKGWFAISLRALRFGDVFHQSYPPNAFEWLSAYQPVARIGKTILLYDISGGTESERR